MTSKEVFCSVLWFLTNHNWSKPLPKDHIINRAGIRRDQKGEAKEVVEELRGKKYIDNYGGRGVCINSSKQASLAKVLYNRCNRNPETINKRLKHFEGIEKFDWYP